MDDEVEAPLDALEPSEELDEDRIGDGIKSIGCTVTLSPS
jgi:hypothetical protein